MLSDDGGAYLTIEQLPEPWRSLLHALSAYEDHPAHRWFTRIGNGVFDDDHAVHGLPAPHPIYRFERAGLAAYVWEGENGWIVRPWRRMRGRVSNAFIRVTSLRVALDELARPNSPWWRFWI